MLAQNDELSDDLGDLQAKLAALSSTPTAIGADASATPKTSGFVTMLNSAASPATPGVIIDTESESPIRNMRASALVPNGRGRAALAPAAAAAPRPTADV